MNAAAGTRCTEAGSRTRRARSPRSCRQTQGPMKGEPLRRTAPHFVHPCFTRNGPLRQTVAAARSVGDNRRKHDDDQDNCFRSAGSRLARASGVGSQRRCMRGRSTPGGMRRSAWRSRRSSWLRLSWRSCCAACLWRTLLLARRRSRLPLTGYLEQAPANELCDLICRHPRQQPNVAVMWRPSAIVMSALTLTTGSISRLAARARHCGSSLPFPWERQPHAGPPVPPRDPPFLIYLPAPDAPPRHASSHGRENRVNGRGGVRWLSQNPRRPRRA